MRECKKCKQTKLIEAFCTMINGGYSYDCKLCRQAYSKAYSLLNKATIRSNERLRKERAKINKTVTEKGIAEYYKHTNKGIQPKEFTLSLCIKLNGDYRKWLVCPIEGVRYYDNLRERKI